MYDNSNSKPDTRPMGLARGREGSRPVTTTPLLCYLTSGIVASHVYIFFTDMLEYIYWKELFRCGVPNIKWVDASYDTPCSGPESYGMFHGQVHLHLHLHLHLQPVSSHQYTSSYPSPAL